ncbi:hypothetical protein NL676_008627 [Syzygium grande]|nr:hypothetical protein NL676_008627 [Syzygium grande]
MKRKSWLDSAAFGQPCDYSIGSWIYDWSFESARYDSSCKEIFKGWNRQIFGSPSSPLSPPINHERNEIFADPSKFDSNFLHVFVGGRLHCSNCFTNRSSTPAYRSISCMFRSLTKMVRDELNNAFRGRQLREVCRCRGYLVGTAVVGAISRPWALSGSKT